MELRVRRARAGDVAAVAAAYVAATADEAVWAWVTAGSAEIVEAFRVEHAPRLIERAVAEDEVWIAGPGDAVWAVSLWHRVTSVQRYRTEAEESAAMAAAAPGVRPLARLATLTALVADHHPREFPHRYLQSIATVPEHRGTGAGGAVIADRLAAATAAGEPVFLEASTERSAALYARLGFTPTGAALALPEDGPVLRPMWFRPGTAAGATGVAGATVTNG